MADEPIMPNARIVRPHRLGWLRRPELESTRYPHIHVWEKPNGEIRNHDARDGDLVFFVPVKQRTE